MRRPGKLLVTLLAAVALTACTVAAPAPTATPDAGPACPEGLADALEVHLLAQPLGDRMPVEAVVTEFPEFEFTSDLVKSLVGCVMSLESVYENGDRMVQAFGLADGLTESDVIAELVTAGWTQLDAEVMPYVWGTEDRSESVGIFTTESELPAFGFDGWGDYLTPDDVIISGALAF